MFLKLMHLLIKHIFNHVPEYQHHMRNFFLRSRLRHLGRNRSVIINSCQHISNFSILYLLLGMISHAMTWQSKTIHQKVFKTKKNPALILTQFPHIPSLNSYFSGELFFFPRIIFLIQSYKYCNSKFFCSFSWSYPFLYDVVFFCMQGT